MNKFENIRNRQGESVGISSSDASLDYVKPEEHSGVEHIRRALLMRSDPFAFERDGRIIKARALRGNNSVQKYTLLEEIDFEEIKYSLCMEDNGFVSKFMEIVNNKVICVEGFDTMLTEKDTNQQIKGFVNDLVKCPSYNGRFNSLGDMIQ
ncbi:MAG: hypothetical protein WD967_01170 [Candidatus Levyibacteriota bacterium]